MAVASSQQIVRSPVVIAIGTWFGGVKSNLTNPRLWRRCWFAVGNDVQESRLRLVNAS